MKRGLVIFGLVFLFIIISFVSAEDTCESLGYGCGVWDVEGVEGPLNCGDCTDGECIVGKCYDFSELGECVNKSNKEMQIKIAAMLGYDTESNCSDLKDECFEDVQCEWENKDIYTTRLYWKGSGISSVRGFGGDDVFIINEEVMENMGDTGILLTMVLRNSKLPEGTEINFEVASMNRLTKIGEEMDEAKVHDTINSIIDKDGNAEVSWVVSEEELEGYDGRKAFFFTIKKEGEVIIENIAYTNMHGTVVAIPPEIRELIFFTKKGECKGIIPCEIVKNKHGCEEVMGEGASCSWIEITNSCEGVGIPCEIIGEEGTCECYNCYWEADSFWIKFTSWLKSLFGF